MALGCLLLRKTSSTPAVVPGAAPALAKAGVGGFKKSSVQVFFFIAFRCVLGVKSDELTEIKITEEAQGRPCFVS